MRFTSELLRKAWKLAREVGQANARRFFGWALKEIRVENSVQIVAQKGVDRRVNGEISFWKGVVVFEGDEMEVDVRTRKGDGRSVRVEDGRLYVSDFEARAAEWRWAKDFRRSQQQRLVERDKKEADDIRAQIRSEIDTLSATDAAKKDAVEHLAAMSDLDVIGKASRGEIASELKKLLQIA